MNNLLESVIKTNFEYEDTINYFSSNENNIYIQPARSFTNHNMHRINSNYYISKANKAMAYTSGLPKQYFTLKVVYCIKLETNVNGNYEDINDRF